MYRISVRLALGSTKRCLITFLDQKRLSSTRTWIVSLCLLVIFRKMTNPSTVLVRSLSTIHLRERRRVFFFSEDNLRMTHTHGYSCRPVPVGACCPIVLDCQTVCYLVFPSWDLRLGGRVVQVSSLLKVSYVCFLLTSHRRRIRILLTDLHFVDAPIHLLFSS